MFGIVHPVVNDFAAVECEVHAVVSGESKGVLGSHVTLQITRPRDGEVGRTQIGYLFRFPRVVYFLFHARSDGRSSGIAVLIIFGREAGRSAGFVGIEECAAVLIGNGLHFTEVNQVNLHAFLLAHSLQAGQRGNAVEGVNLATATAIDITVGIGAHDTDFFDRSGVERQEIIGIFQEYQTLGGRLIGHLTVLGIVEGYGVVSRGIFVQMEVVNGTQNVEHLLVNVCLFHFAFGNVFLQLVRLQLVVSWRGSFQIHTMIGQIDNMVGTPSAALGIVRGTPVAHRHERIVPLLAQHRLHQETVLTTINTVHQIVARHDGTDIGVLNRMAECREIDFLKGAFIHIGTGRESSVLHEVGGKVFHHTHYTGIALHTLYVAARYLGCKPGVFAHILKVTAATR